MKNSNKKNGNRFEQEFCDYMFEQGYWCHNMAQNQHGQPADVMIAKNNNVTLIDCKVCKNNTFPLSRIEENQEQAMKLWQESGNTECGFVLKTDNGVYWFSFNEMQCFKFLGVKSLNQEVIEREQFKVY